MSEQPTLPVFPISPPGQLSSLPPLGLYIHFPWCVRKCPYCDFNSHTLRETLPEDDYVTALLRDLEGMLPLVWGRTVHTVFMGGGTPSLFSPAAIDRLLTQLRTLLRLDPLAEITLEANPGTFEVARFRDYRAAGVNRLSIGVQSFSDDHLRSLGRIHGAAEAHAAVAAALDIFDSVNLDLMYALPGQNLEQLQQDLDTALQYRPQHLSAYHLTLEPNTPFAAHPPALPESDLAADMQEWVEARLAAAGYEHYETSAFALPGHRCRHNLNYWQFGDYLGIGAGAHGKLSFPERILRQARVKHPRAYLEHVGTAAAFAETREVSQLERPFEFMMNALRLTQGFPIDLFTSRTGLATSSIQQALAKAGAQGLIERTLSEIRPTLKGQRFLNELLQHFLV